MPRGGRREGSGRKVGVPNKLNADLKAMILGALDDAGGREYLAARAIDTPVAFMSLLGKVLPMQLTGENGGALAIDFRWLDAPDPSLESPALLMIDAEVDE
jgi:hypothetical protein